MTKADQGPVMLSLIVATIGDGGAIDRLLGSLAIAAPGPRFEVVIVDQNDDDRLAATIARHGNALTIHHERVAFRGASRARNHGAMLARGAWLGFPDDDCMFLPDTLPCVARLARDPALGVVTGQTVDEHGRPTVLRWKPAATDLTPWTLFGCVTEATLFVQRELFLTVGGFDEAFGPGGRWPAAEGVDLMLRLMPALAGRRARYDPAVKLQHPDKIPPWNRWAARRFYQYAQGDGALIAKHPSLPMLSWGCRTLLAGARGALTLTRWKCAAHLMRIVGLLKGVISYRVSVMRGPRCAA